MPRNRCYRPLMVLLGLAVQWVALATAAPVFPAVPPPSPNIVAPHAGFPEVPPPSPNLKAAPAASARATVGLAQPDTRAQREEDMKLKKEQQAAKAREAKAQRELEAAKKAGKAPANAYATPTVVEVPKTFVGKEAELQELFILYKAGRVSPEDYHKKRAQLIARP
jgi:hypothetical protein